MERLPYVLVRLWSRRGGELVGHMVVSAYFAAVIHAEGDAVIDCTVLIASPRRLHDEIAALTAEANPAVLDDRDSELRLLYEEAAPHARHAEVVDVGAITIAAARYAGPRLLDRLVDWRAREVVPSWAPVTHAVGELAQTVGAPRGVNIAGAEGRRSDNNLPMFLVSTAEGASALTLTLRPSERSVRVFAELASGGWWEGSYRIEADGTWVGPIAPGAQAERVAGIDRIAREIVDGWLTAVVPHHS